MMDVIETIILGLAAMTVFTVSVSAMMILFLEVIDALPRD